MPYARQHRIGQGIELERVDMLATIDSKEKDHETNDLGLQDLLRELQGFEFCENLSEHSVIGY